MLTKQFKITLAVLFFIAILGIITMQQMRMQDEINELRQRPVAVMPTTEEVSPTASPTATLVPTKLPIRITVSPTR